MPTADDIRTMLPSMIHDIAGVPMDQIHHDATFRGDLQIDSLSMAELMVATEDTFHIVIPDEDLADLTTIDQVAAYVARLVA